LFISVIGSFIPPQFGVVDEPVSFIPILADQPETPSPDLFVTHHLLVSGLKYPMGF
jgi:hypothetical protein